MRLNKNRAFFHINILQQSHSIVNFLWLSKKWKGIEEEESFLLNCLSREAGLGVESGSACMSAQSKAHKKFHSLIEKIFCAPPKIKKRNLCGLCSDALSARRSRWVGRRPERGTIQMQEFSIK